MKMNKLALVPCVVIGLGTLTGCTTAPESAAARENLAQAAEETIERFRENDPSLEQFFDSAHAYAVFPSIAKGGIGVGGAYGKGIAYEQGQMVGYCDLSQGSIGFQLGGQEYSELIFFENKSNFDSFKNGTVEFAAQASAVAATAGASADANYEIGVAVFTIAKGGLMYEASIGGQGFDFTPATSFADADD